MADDKIVVELAVDATQLNQGIAYAKNSLGGLNDAVAQMAAKFMQQGLSEKEAQAALVSLGYTTKEASAAMSMLGFAQDAASAKGVAVATSMTGFERAAAMAGGRVLGMEAGLGMAGSALGRVASYLPGLGEAFVVALPIALIADAVEKIEQFRDAVEKAKREEEDLAIASYKVAEAVQLENLKLEDQISKLEKRPEKNQLKEALLEDKAAAEDLGKSLGEAIQKSNDLLTVGVFSQFFAKASGNETAAKEAVQPILDQITDARLRLAEAPAGSDAGKKAVQDQIELYDQLKKKLDLLILDMEAAGTRHGQFIDADSIAKLKDLQIIATNATTALKSMQEQAPLRAEVGILEQKKAVEDYWKTYSEGFSKTESDLARHDEFWKRFFADQMKEAQKTQDELSKIDEEGARERAAIDDRIAAQTTETNIDNARAEAKAVEDELRKITITHEQAIAGKTGFEQLFGDRAELAAINTEMQAVSNTMARLKQDMAAINAQPFESETDQRDLQKYSAELAQQEQLLTRLQAEYQKTTEKIESTWRQLSERIAQTFTASVNSVLLGQERIGQAAVKLAQQLELSLIDRGIKNVATEYGEQFLKMLATHTGFITQFLAAHSSFLATLLGIDTASSATQLAQAKVAQTAIVTSLAGEAYAAGFASTMAALPFPANIAAAPAVAAEAAAETLGGIAYEKGGIIPGTVGQAVPIIGHAGEAVLPEKITNFIYGAADHIANSLSSVSNSSSTNSTTHVRPTININHSGGKMSDNDVAKAVQRGIRRGMLGR